MYLAPFPDTGYTVFSFPKWRRWSFAALSYLQCGRAAVDPIEYCRASSHHASRASDHQQEKSAMSWNDATFGLIENASIGIKMETYRAGLIQCLLKHHCSGFSCPCQYCNSIVVLLLSRLAAALPAPVV